MTFGVWLSAAIVLERNATDCGGIYGAFAAKSLLVGVFCPLFAVSDVLKKWLKCVIFLVPAKGLEPLTA